MKMSWTEAMIWCVVIVVMAIAAAEHYSSGEAARGQILDMIDKELRNATRDILDRLKLESTRDWSFRNSISLQTLHEGVKDASIHYEGRHPPHPESLPIFVDNQKIGVLHLHVDQNRENVEDLGKPWETDYSIEAARSYMLTIIDKALLEATKDTLDYLEPDRSRLYFRNSISLQTLHDRVKSANIKDGSLGANVYAPFFLTGPIILVGEQEIGRDYRLYWKYEDIWWTVYLSNSRYSEIPYRYIFHIGETGEGFGMYPGMDQEMGPYLSDPHGYIDKNMKIISPDSSDPSKSISLKHGDSVTLSVDLDGSESLILITLCYMNITVRKPDGSISLYLEHPDTEMLNQLAIPVDEAGTWNVTVASIDLGTRGQYCPVRLFTRPAAVKLDLPEVTNDPYLLSRFVADLPGTIVVTENGEPLSLSQPLAEGRHDLRFQRILADGRESQVTRGSFIVDSLAPEITFEDASTVMGNSVTSNDPSEEARSYLFGIIDETLRDSSEGVPDYLDRANTLVIDTLEPLPEEKPYVEATVSSHVVVRGDRFFIRGIAEDGPSNGVAIWIFGKNFVSYATANVNADKTFEHEIKDGVTSNMLSGQYFVVVQHPMYNDQFDVYPDSARYPQYVLGSFPSRGSELFRLAGPGSLQDNDAAEALINSLNSAMVDDTYIELHFLVDEPKISINPIGEQTVGSKFEITGTTNLGYDGNELLVEVTPPFIPCSKDYCGHRPSGEAAVGVVPVTQGTDGLNKWAFTVDVARFRPGEYTVRVSGVTVGVVDTTTLTVTEAYVKATASSNVAVRGDRFFIRGTAEGDPSNGVAIWIFGENFVSYATANVNADKTFEHEIKDGVTSNMLSGQYFVVVQHPMYNNIFDVYPDSAPNPQYVLEAFQTRGSSRGSELFKFAGPDSLQGSDAAEALINALNRAMVDDAYTELQFLVEEAKISINPIGEQIIGSTFKITGTTNLHYDGNELLVEVFGPPNYATGTAPITQGTDGLNKWTFIFDTANFRPDEYIVRVVGMTVDVVDTTIFPLVEPYVKSTVSSNIVARGDRFYIRGTAGGDQSDVVAIWIFGNNSVSYSTERVNADKTFEHEVRDGVTSNMRSGQYFVVVQHPMYNDQFDVYPDSARDPCYVLGTFPTRGSDLFKLAGPDSLQGSDAAEALVNALNSAMVDDIYTELQFRVEEAKISINPIGEQTVGSKFEITGTTNLNYDGNDLLVEVTLSSLIPTSKDQSGWFWGAAGTVPVTQGTDGLNKWAFTVDTTTFRPGEYTVRVSGVTVAAVETTTCTFVEAPTPTPTPELTPEPTQTSPDTIYEALLEVTTDIRALFQGYIHLIKEKGEGYSMPSGGMLFDLVVDPGSIRIGGDDVAIEVNVVRNVEARGSGNHGIINVHANSGVTTKLNVGRNIITDTGQGIYMLYLTHIF